MRFAAACDRLGLRPCKAYLSAVITWLFAQDAAQASATLQVGTLCIGALVGVPPAPQPALCRCESGIRLVAA